LRSHDNKRKWIGINQSEPYGYENKCFSGDDAVVERIIENCACRVKISTTDMKRYWNICLKNAHFLTVVICGILIMRIHVRSMD
jgi:hypothetical protein